MCCIIEKNWIGKEKIYVDTLYRLDLNSVQLEAHTSNCHVNVSIGKHVVIKMGCFNSQVAEL